MEEFSKKLWEYFWSELYDLHINGRKTKQICFLIEVIVIKINVEIRRKKNIKINIILKIKKKLFKNISRN